MAVVNGMDLGYLLRTANEVNYREGGSDNYYGDVERILNLAGASLAEIVEALDTVDNGAILGSCFRWLIDESNLPKPLLRHVLESYLFHENWMTREGAASALYALNDPAAIRALEIALGREQSTYTQLTMIEAIRHLSDPDGTLREFLKARASQLADLLRSKAHTQLREKLCYWYKKAQWNWSMVDEPSHLLKEALALLPPLQETDPGRARPHITSNTIIFMVFNDYHLWWSPKPEQPKPLDAIYQAMWESINEYP